MHEVFMTVMGNIASRPRSALTKNGHSVTSFRLASTPRRYDRARGAWTDGTTMWFTVTCWRSLADHIASCVSVGDPVVVHGRLQVKEYTREDGAVGTSLELDATTVGHDLTRGTAMFKKSTPSPDSGAASADTTAEDLARRVSEEEPALEPTAPAAVDTAAAPGSPDPARAA